MINKLQILKGKTKPKFYQFISNFYEEMNFKRGRRIFQFEEDSFANKAEGISIIYQEVLLKLKNLQTKPQVKSMNVKYFDLFDAFIESRGEKEIETDEYEKTEIHYVKYKDFIIPDRHIGIKPRETKIG